MLEFVDSVLYFDFVEDENNFINPLLDVGSNEKSTGSGSGGPKINGSGRIRILIPDVNTCYIIVRKLSEADFQGNHI